MKICENCGKEHDGSFASGRFCSEKCRRHYTSVISAQTRLKNGTFKSNLKIKCAPYGTWKCSICDEIFITRKQLELHKKEIHHGNAKCKYCGKIFKNCRQLGGHINSCKLNPNIIQIKTNISNKLKGISHIHSKETREKLSEVRSKYLDSCSAGFQDVKWYKVKNLNGTEFTVRGHWEENVALRLNTLGILWTKNIWLKYEKDGIKKTYNPDFYLPNTNEFIEVKGYFSEKDKEKMYLVLNYNPNVRIYFLSQDRYFDFISDNGKLTENFIYKDS